MTDAPSDQQTEYEWPDPSVTPYWMRRKKLHYVRASTGSHLIRSAHTGELRFANDNRDDNWKGGWTPCTVTPPAAPSDGQRELAERIAADDLTVRDRFALSALAHLLIDKKIYDEQHGLTSKQTALAAYDLADSMLSVRGTPAAHLPAAPQPEAATGDADREAWEKFRQWNVARLESPEHDEYRRAVEITVNMMDTLLPPAPQEPKPERPEKCQAWDTLRAELVQTCDEVNTHMFGKPYKHVLSRMDELLPPESTNTR